MTVVKPIFEKIESDFSFKDYNYSFPKNSYNFK